MKLKTETIRKLITGTMIAMLCIFTHPMEAKAAWVSVGSLAGGAIPILNLKRCTTRLVFTYPTGQGTATIQFGKTTELQYRDPAGAVTYQILRYQFSVFDISQLILGGGVIDNPQLPPFSQYILGLYADATQRPFNEAIGVTSFPQGPPSNSSLNFDHFTPQGQIMTDIWDLDLAKFTIEKNCI